MIEIISNFIKDNIFATVSTFFALTGTFFTLKERFRKDKIETIKNSIDSDELILSALQDVKRRNALLEKEIDKLYEKIDSFRRENNQLKTKVEEQRAQIEKLITKIESRK